ncbi:MAG TPA: hypothetical protein VGA36_12200 [Nitriliruptorales bacterium]
MARIEMDQASTDRGKHLVDLLADGLGHEQPAPPVGDRSLRASYVLGGVSIALLVTGVATVLLS